MPGPNYNQTLVFKFVKLRHKMTKKGFSHLSLFNFLNTVFRICVSKTVNIFACLFVCVCSELEQCSFSQSFAG